MQLLRFIPVRLTILLIAGILTARLTDMPAGLPFLLTGISLIAPALQLLGLVRLPAWLYGICIALAIFTTGILSYVISMPENQRNHYLQHNLTGTHLLHLRIREVLKPTAYAARYVAVMDQADSLKVKGRVLLNVTPAGQRVFGVDDHLLVKAGLAEIKPNPNPFQFNYRQYLRDLGIPRQLTVQNSHILQQPASKTTFFGKAAGIRKKVVTTLKQAGMDEEALSIVSALLLGQRTTVSEDTFLAYRNAGAVHILAVSGLHIGILLLLINFLLRPLEYLPGGRIARFGLLLGLLWGYALLAGFSASIIRAVSMFSFVAYALYLNRPANSFNIVALSMFFILLAINPGLLFQVGFQLSYAAVLAIVWIYPLLQKHWVPRNTLALKIWQLISVSIAAQLGVLPVSLFYFHQFPGLFIISNLLVIPFLGVLLGYGFLVIALAYWDLLPKLFLTVYEFLINAMTILVRWISAQEDFIFSNIPFELPDLLLLSLLIVCLAQLLARQSFPRVVMMLLAAISLQCSVCWGAYSKLGVEKVWILHKPRQTMLIHQAGDSLIVTSNADQADERLLEAFRVSTRCRTICRAPLQRAYRWDASKLVVLDKYSAWPVPDGKTLCLLLTNSPKIHMGRLLDSLRPAIVVADGSNYPSYAAHWKASCLRRNIPFHYTGNDGAYCLSVAED